MTKRNVAAFCIYVGMAASGWILQLAFPSSLPEVETGALVSAVLCIGGGLSAAAWERMDLTQMRQAIVAGLLLFGVPSLPFDHSVVSLPALTRVALLALVPAVLLSISNASGPSGAAFLPLLGASLAGLAGALLLLPADPALLLKRPLAGVMMGVAVLSIAVGGYMGHGAARGLGLRPFILLMLGPSLVLTGGVAAFLHSAFTMPGWGDVPLLLWSGIEVVLLLHLVRVMTPVSLAVRYLLIPLVTALQGLAYVRPQVTLRLVIGVALLGFGSLRLLVGDGRAEEPSVSLL